jgi:hypothetical protein
MTLPGIPHDTPALLLCSLRDIQGRRYLTDKEFAAFLEIDEKTLRRLKDPEQRRTVSMITRRRIAERLGRPPHTVVELLWTPSPTYLAEIDALLDNGDTGLVAGDPETGRPTGQRLRLSELDGEV